MKIFNRSLLATVSTAVMLSGCGGSGAGLDQNGNPQNSNTGASQGAGSVLTADFQSIQDNVFTPICTVCHIGAAAPLGLRLDEANSYTLLVGVASSESPGLQRVNPGDPNASYLLQKLAGTATVGQRMPLGGPYLPQTTIDVISQWIASGAQRPLATAPSDKTAQSLAGGLRVVTTSPMDNITVDSPPAQIVVGFDRELNATLVNDSTVLLERIDPDRPPDERIPITLTVPLDNPQVVLIAPRRMLSAGLYRVTLRGTGGGVLAGLDAHVLNASVDSNRGADFVFAFTVGAQP